jgi:hypothetical protein
LTWTKTSLNWWGMAGLHQDEASVPRRIFGKAGSDNRKSDLSSLENTVPHIVQPIYKGDRDSSENSPDTTKHDQKILTKLLRSSPALPSIYHREEWHYALQKTKKI